MRKTARSIPTIVLALALISVSACSEADGTTSEDTLAQYNDVLWSGMLGEDDGTDVAVREVFFPPGWVAPRHYHNSDLFLYVLEGEFEVTLEGQARTVYTRGEALEMRAGTAMEARNVSDTQPLKFVVFQFGQTQAPFVVPAPGSAP
ncbi:MAG: cupin domain-containing protein [Gemmatimonadota bacterium]